MKTIYTLDEVREAFKMMQDRVAKSGVDAACMWALHYAIDDGIRNLTGDFAPADEDRLRLEALEARTAGDFDAAVLRRLPGFDELAQVERERLDIDPFWQPTPATNEAMLGALEVFLGKFFGAMSRGASRSEATTFARMEARRAYRQLSGE